MTATDLLNAFFTGILVCASLVSSLFFFRFWSRTRDRLFLLFAFSFVLLALNWLSLFVLLLTEPAQKFAEYRPFFYLLRLSAFLLIAAAIVDKNRTRKSRAAQPPLAVRSQLP